MFKRLALPVLTGVAVCLSGCSVVYKPAGKVISSLAQDEVVPYVFGSGDLDMSACGTGRGQHQLLASFSRVVDRPSKVLLNTNLLAGLCSEQAAHDAQLRFERALRAGDTSEARDARIESQRLFRLTALRRYQVYKDTVSAFGELGGESCPALGNETEQAEYLVGTLTSVQAVLSDIQAASSVGVPQDVAARAARAAECLDNEKWWGVPDALQAIVWLSVPGSAPEGVDPWDQMRAAADYGETRGMPMAAMLYMLAGYGRSDIEREKRGIRQVADIYKNEDPPEDYLILAEVAHSRALFHSDLIWTQETGQRTPFLGLGEFPGEESENQSDFDAGSLLD